METIKLSSCLVHRYTLYNLIYCFKCKDTICQLKSHEILCSSCFGRVQNDNCSNCLSCFFCGRYGRLPGFCLFCSKIFNTKSLLSCQNKNPSWFLAYLIDSSFLFMICDKNQKVDKNIILLILAYL